MPQQLRIACQLSVWNALPVCVMLQCAVSAWGSRQQQQVSPAVDLAS